ncbi:MlaD family protein [Rhodococcus sp. NPDC079359]|uniref:MlaD family protein n=1 Tax=Rhodococcus sp. NPDC079359 TaxID=3154961 RepID=UPI00344B0E91
MRCRSVRIAVAAAVVVTLVGSVASATSVIDRGAGNSSLCAEFTDTVGLYEGNSVMMLGVVVGTVTRIENSDAAVVVTMDIDDSLRLPAEVGAVTLSNSIVTDRHVELTQPYIDGPEFDRSSCIPLDRTRTPLGISDTLDAVSGLASDLLGPADAEATTTRSSATPCVRPTIRSAAPVPSSTTVFGNWRSWSAILPTRTPPCGV